MENDFYNMNNKKNSKKKTRKQKYFPICPKCSSIDIGTDFSNPVVWNYGTPPKRRCNSCGYIGQIFPEILESKIATFKKELKDKIDNRMIKPTKEDKIDAKTGYFITLFEVGAFFIAITIGLLLGGIYAYRDLIVKNPLIYILIIIIGAIILSWIILLVIYKIRK